jgi:hypothetical protein
VSRISPLIAIGLSLFLLTTACGSDGTTDVSTASNSDAQSESDNDSADNDSADNDEPIPVELDGGIGDGAEPLPGAEEPEDTGTWHGAEVAETNCPGTEWARVQASAFSFSVPADFVDNEAQGIDSEVAMWSGGNNIEVLFDYGWYSGSSSDSPGAENETVDYSGIAGEQTVFRDAMQVGVYFDEVAVIDGQAGKLSMVVNYSNPDDEIIGRCIVGSIEWVSPDS